MVGSVDAVLRRGAWTEEEDKLLRKCIEIYGEGKWHQIPLRAVIKNQEIPKTVVIKPRPRTFSKTSPWLRQKQITVLENDSNPSDPTMDPLEKDNNNNNTNYNAADDDDIMWWKSVLDDNGGSTCSTRELGEKPITHLWVDEENIAPAAAMEIGDNTAMELGQLDWWSDISFEEDLWDILIAI
ncbi:hypothetical protein JRO89_XS11G0020000 [Xanthoceras sorbifolium]|uniref:Uncharacterized protein n=1 Tax=Xanthoceras sorbifolium TaxID=99658 RepID=A0ABQ8HEC9_9ROSI|nr:hypothetical protein JRO89_XS11G0020000 [Xanthoceras sorbifolium]